jgi:hypothetical protein
VSFGAVLLVLRLNPQVAWLERVPLLGRLVTVVNARAITIYLWHNVAIAFAPSIGDMIGWDSEGQHFLIAVWLIIVAVLAFGWVEDLAAGRALSVLPDGRGRARAARTVEGPRPPVIPTDVENGETSALSQGSLRARIGRLTGAAPVPGPHADRVAAVVPPRPRPGGPPVPAGRRPVPASPPTGVPVGAGRYTRVPAGTAPARPGGPVTGTWAGGPAPVPAPPPPLPAPAPHPSPPAGARPRPASPPPGAGWPAPEDRTGHVPARPAGRHHRAADDRRP